MVVFSEMADDLERTAEGIGEDEKADQQDDNSRHHKMAPEKIWNGLERYYDFAYVHSIKCESNANREYRTPEIALQEACIP